MMASDQEKNLFNSISRSHPYWGHKPIRGLLRVLEGLEPGDVFCAPFCGGGTSIVVALEKGARVIASDLNPMAVFLSKVLIQPVGIFSLKEAFEKIRDDVCETILENYTISCPKCRKKVSFDYLKWGGKEGEVQPEAVKVTCRHCGLNELAPLKEKERKRQKGLSRIRPKLWFPQVPVGSPGKTKVEFFHDFFTGRNLTSLSILYSAIDNISQDRCKAALQYVFTATLYSGILPKAKKEGNVWQVFEGRFRNFLRCKREINTRLPFVRLSDSMKEFESSNDAAYIHEADFVKSPFPRHTPVSHIFIEPSYIHNMDYIGLSAFGGGWLGMDADTKAGRHPGTKPIEQNADHLYRLLKRVRENTTPSCVIILAYDLGKEKVRERIQEKISEAGYSLQPVDGYFLLLRKEKQRTSVPEEFSESDQTELQFFLRVTSYLLPGANTDTIRERANSLLRIQLQRLLLKQKKADIDQWISDRESNRRSYNRLAFLFITPILARDGFRIISADAGEFDHCLLKGYGDIGVLPMPKGLAKRAAFVAENVRGNRIFLCFYQESKVDALRRIAKRVFKDENDKFHNICYLVFPDQKVMMNCRQVEQADNWPRAFFIEFNELLEKAGEIDNNCFGHLKRISPQARSDFGYRKKIEHFNAKVIKNSPVGVKDDPKHFMLRFEAPRLEYIVPGQFVMIDTLSCDRRKKIDKNRSFYGSDVQRGHFSMAHKTNPIPQSFLKRPFSIHRAYYRHFESDYQGNTYLSRDLAAITHTVFPHKFDIIYKIIEDGTGTNELTTMKKGDSFKILGPLGKKTNPAAWRSDGIEEVHLIGGGVGMAPLIFFGQALKYTSFRVKAFIGIDRIESLLFEAPLETTLGKKGTDKAFVYVDNLRSIGIGEDDIHISFEKPMKERAIDTGLPGKNLFKGLVSEHYNAFIGGLNRTKGMLVLACGPIPMLKALEKITSEAHIRMKVLLEKRMGCGIGVCMSCVCPTKKNNEEHYSRVCMDGPLFDSEDIDWERL